jgi:hypothetical protein
MARTMQCARKRIIKRTREEEKTSDTTSSSNKRLIKPLIILKSVILEQQHQSLPTSLVIRQVINNFDLMHLVASFLAQVDHKQDRCKTILLCSPVLPLLLTFRSLYNKAYPLLEMDAQNRSKEFVIKSNKFDFMSSVEMIAWAQDMGANFRSLEDSLCSIAASRGFLEVVKLARYQSPPFPWDSRASRGCLKEGKVSRYHIPPR